MKSFAILLLVFTVPLVSFTQNEEKAKLKKNSIIITPLGDLINNSKSSIYYRRELGNRSKVCLSLRIGTELLNSVKNEYSTGRRDEASIRNLKTGFEIGKNINKMIVYFGPEISYTKSKVNDATLSPTGQAIFSTESIVAEEWSGIDKAEMSIFSLIGFVGFKYKLTKFISLGVESAIGVGWYNSEQSYDSSLPFLQGDQNKGVIKDLAVTRFFLLEYSF